MDDDDVTVTIQMDLEEAVEHLPAPQRRDARGLLEQSGLEGGKLRVLDLLKEDPDQF